MFLRRIRKFLLNSDSTRKYVLYASGEIALIVIGILLALQINNWNEDRKQKSLQIAYLQRLKQDLQSDILYVKQRIEDSEQERKGYYSFIHKAYKTQSSAKEFSELLVLNRFSSLHLTVNNSTYLEMLNAGHINIIRNENLRIKIIDLYRTYESVGKHVEEINIFTSSMLLNTAEEIELLKYSPHSASLFDSDLFTDPAEWSWINDRQSKGFQSYENTLTMYYLKHGIFIEYFKDLIDQIESISEGIDIEISI